MAIHLICLSTSAIPLRVVVGGNKDIISTLPVFRYTRPSPPMTLTVKGYALVAKYIFVLTGQSYVRIARPGRGVAGTSEWVRMLLDVTINLVATVEKVLATSNG